MGILLLWAAWVFHLVLRIAFFWYKPIFYISRLGFKKGLAELNQHYIHQALAEDQAANVSLWMLFNKFFTKGKGIYYYGDEDDTISYCTAMNYHKGASPGGRKWLNKLLRAVDKDHDLKSINSRILRDLESVERLKAAGIIKAEQVILVSEGLGDDSWKLYVENVTNSERKIKF